MAPQLPNPEPPPASKPTLRQIRVAREAERDRAATGVLTVVVVIASLGSFVFAMLSGAVALDVCLEGCDTAVNIAVIGVMWGGIGVAAVTGWVGVRRARAQGRPTRYWPLTALLIVVVSAVAGVVIMNVATGMG
jgi:hypothetical protein